MIDDYGAPFPRCHRKGLTVLDDGCVCYVTWDDLRATLTPVEYANFAWSFFGKTVAMQGPYAYDVERLLAEGAPVEEAETQ